MSFGRPSYAALFGLWLNQDRADARLASAVAHGVSIAFGAKPDPGLLGAMARTPAEAQELESEANRRRKMRESEERHGGGFGHG